MVAGCGPKIAKLLLLIINFAVWASSLALVGLGIWMLVEASRFEELFSEDKITPVAGIILGLGCFCFIVGFCGCCGAMKENICFLKTYFCLLLLIVLGELTAGILALVYKGELEGSMTEGMTKTISESYGEYNSATETIDYMQEKFECCGAYNYTDYTDSVWQVEEGKLPPSCCTATTPPDPCSYTSPTRHEPGCVAASIGKIESNIAILAGVCLGVLVFEIIAMMFSCCVIDAVQEKA
ncbi:CD63 antigen-like [Apostichopus japonicus]|uniref:CD63 antigen-like n=1 Tax=Stichopus japonicus TaxID=307972 RepID=UPI003AB6F574